MSTRNQTQPEKAFRQLLISVDRNLDAGDWSIDAGALGLERVAPFYVAKRRLRGGRQEGVDVITLSSGRLSLTVVPTRGMGILRATFGDLQLGWESPVREIVHPQFVNLESRGGLGWLQGFNEWLVRCGLEFAGGPGRDKFITNTGAEAEMDLTLHGKIANIPASEVELLVDLEPSPRVRLRGRVLETMFYGPKLELWSEISLEPNSNSFRIEDTVCNRGGTDQEFELIYHINFGPPLLEAGSVFTAAAKRVSPMNPHAARDIGKYTSYLGSTNGFVEQVYCLRPMADRKGRTTVLLQNAARDRAVSLSYLLEQLPCFTLWKNTNRLEEGYVTGLEPGTNYPFNRRIERKAGRLAKLQPGQSRKFAIDVSLCPDKESVSQTAKAITAIQAGKPTQVDTEPGLGAADS
jgi:hypothetical protein